MDYHPKKKRKTNLPESIFFVLLVLLSGFILFQSPLFEIRQIIVKETTIPADTIESISGINIGQNIFKLDKESAVKKIKYLPLIKTVKITRRLPSTVLIGVEERQAVGILPVKSGFVQVDIEGIFLRKVDISSVELPIITGVEVDFTGIGKKANSEELITVLNVINDLPVELVPKLSEAHIDDHGRIQLYLLEGIQCRLGLPENIKQKGSVLMEVLQELQSNGKKIDYIDFSYPNNPVVKYNSS